MLLTVNPSTQDIVQQPGISSPLPSITVPRSATVPIVVQFAGDDGTIIDPEAKTASITSCTVAANTVFTAPAHGFSAADVVVLAGVTGAPKTISSSTSASPSVLTVTAHGYANGQTVTLSGHSSIADGDYVVAGVTTNTFTIGVNTTSAGAGGTVTAALVNPDVNGSHTIASVTDDTFTITGLNTLSAGEGGTATRYTDLNLRWTVKADGQFDGATVASIIPPSGFTKSGSGTTTKFTGACNYITAEMNSLLGIDPVSTGNISSISGSEWTASGAHLLSVGDTIVFAADTIPTGIVEGQTYFIKTAPSSTTFTIAATSGGTVITPTTSGATVTFSGYLTVDDEEQATCMAELKWEGHTPSKSNWVTHYVRNDLYKDGDSDAVTVNGENGRVTIASGESTKEVTFATPLASADWRFLGAPTITNTHASALGITYVGLSVKTANGFTAILSGTTDSNGTYQMDYSVRPN